MLVHNGEHRDVICHHPINHNIRKASKLTTPCSFIKNRPSQGVLKNPFEPCIELTREVQAETIPASFIMLNGVHGLRFGVGFDHQLHRGKRA